MHEKKKLFAPECEFPTTFSFAFFLHYEGFPHRLLNFRCFFIMHIDFLILVKELEAANDPHDHLGLHKAIIFIKAEDFAFWQEKEKKRTKD